MTSLVNPVRPHPNPLPEAPRERGRGNGAEIPSPPGRRWRVAPDEGLWRFSLVKGFRRVVDRVDPLEIRVHADVGH